MPVSVTGQRVRIGRNGPQLDMLWLTEGAAVQAAAGGKGASLYEQRMQDAKTALDLLPYPAWARAADLSLIMCNKAYAEAVDASPEDVLRDQLELAEQAARGGGKILAGAAVAAGAPQNERRHAIVEGKRRLYEVTEIPLKLDNGETPVLLGAAIDVTPLEEKEIELQRHLAAHNEVLEHLGSAIAIYGPDTRLEFFNRAYQRLWDAEEAFLQGKPTFGEIIEDLRARRRAPEQADFQRYKKERVGLFTSLLEPREDLMHLPDGTSLAHSGGAASVRRVDVRA